MGTSVLSPQDCLATSHSQHRHQFTLMIHTPASGPRSGREAIQASTVQCMFPSPASDCARRNSSGAVIRADEGRQNGVPGLLPVPGNHLPRQSSLVRSSSHSSSSPSSRHSVSAASSPSRHPILSPDSLPGFPFTTVLNAKIKASRSASCGFRRRGVQTSSGSERLHSSDGRLPFEVVQGNGVVNRAAGRGPKAAAPVKHSDKLTSKFLDANSGVGQKRGGSEHRRDSRKPHRDLSFRQQGFLEKDAITLSRNVSLQVTKEQRKEFEGKKVGNRRQEDRGNAYEKHPGETPVVTILQRPKDKGAADELIAKFFKMVDGSSSVNEGSQLENQNKEGRSEDSTWSSKEDSGSDELSDSAFHQDMVVPRMQKLPDPPLSPTVVKKDELFHGVQLLSQGPDAQIAESSPSQYVSEVKETLSEMDVDVGSDIDSMLGIDGWVGNERWAGPAYTNSPPPSSLPLPKFSMKQSRTSSLELSPNKYQHVGGLSVLSSARTSSMPISLPHRSGLLLSPTAVHDQENARDAAFATKDLRRILNLDSC